MKLTRVLTALIVLVATAHAFAQAPDTSARTNLEAKAATAVNAKNWQDAESAFKQLVAMEPARADYRRSLAAAQANLGRYPDALASLEAAIALAEKGAPGSPAEPAKAKSALADMLVAKGNILLKLKKVPDALAAYERAATLSANPAIAYFNICATLYNAGKMPEALAACDRAIAVDPKRADAYFIKGSVLVGDGRMQNGKFTVRKDTVGVLNQYLLLAPNGPHVADVKAMLDAIK
jgi:tetratricopeptide (TPR) repeat protein